MNSCLYSSYFKSVSTVRYKDGVITATFLSPFSINSLDAHRDRDIAKEEARSAIEMQPNSQQHQPKAFTIFCSLNALSSCLSIALVYFAATLTKLTDIMLSFLIVFSGTVIAKYDMVHRFGIQLLLYVIDQA